MNAPNASVLLNRFVVRAKFRHMQVLVKLSELGSMRRAAVAVNMTQPAISGIVSELEKLMETDLFLRHARGVEPTTATRELLPVAYRILSALEDGAEAVASRLQQQSGVVRVAASPAGVGGMISGRLDAFARKHPNIQVHIAQVADRDPLEEISDGAVDLVCSRKPAVVPEGWTFEPSAEDEVIVVCSHTHPLAGRTDLGPEALGQAVWLMNRVGTVARNIFEDCAARHDWPVSCRCDVIMQIPTLTKEMLLTGRYLAIVPRSVALPWLNAGEVCALSCEIGGALDPLGVLWRKDRSGIATAAFVKHLLAKRV